MVGSTARPSAAGSGANTVTSPLLKIPSLFSVGSFGKTDSCFSSFFGCFWLKIWLSMVNEDSFFRRGSTNVDMIPTAKKAGFLELSGAPKFYYQLSGGSQGNKPQQF